MKTTLLLLIAVSICSLSFAQGSQVPPALQDHSAKVKTAVPEPSNPMVHQDRQQTKVRFESAYGLHLTDAEFRNVCTASLENIEKWEYVIAHFSGSQESDLKRIDGLVKQMKNHVKVIELQATKEIEKLQQENEALKNRMIQLEKRTEISAEDKVDQQKRCEARMEAIRIRLEQLSQ